MNLKQMICAAIFIAALIGTAIWMTRGNIAPPNETAVNAAPTAATISSNSSKPINSAARVAMPTPTTSGATILERALKSDANTPTANAGASLYSTHCAICHGIDLEGQPNWRSANEDGSLKAPPHDDSGHTWHHDDRMLYNYTRLGGKALMAQAGIENFRSGMPAFGGVLSDQEIVQIFDFIKSRWSKRNQKIQRDRSTNQEQTTSNKEKLKR